MLKTQAKAYALQVWACPQKAHVGCCAGHLCDCGPGPIPECASLMCAWSGQSADLNQSCGFGPCGLQFP